MTTTMDKRKRSSEDELCDTPLSKRINNLHLSNFEESQNENTDHLAHEQSIYNQHTGTSPGISTVYVNADMAQLHLHNVNCNLYNPELNQTQNPFYYLKNKLLHELHLERLKRSAD